MPPSQVSAADHGPLCAERMTAVASSPRAERESHPRTARPEPFKNCRRDAMNSTVSLEVGALAVGGRGGVSSAVRGTAPLGQKDLPKIEKAPTIRSPFVKFCFGKAWRRSDAHHVLGLQSLRTLLDLELHLRALIQRAVAVRLDR